MDGYLRPEAREWTCAPASGDARAFHRGLPGYAPTPLIELPGRMFVKDESQRFGLGAFKMLGASWAIFRALSRHVGGAVDISQLRERLVDGPRLVTATDGNHGRAVARMATMLGLASEVYIPAEVAPEAAARIEAEGATLKVVDGTYDEAVRLAAKADGLLIQDTAWPGYEEIPGWIVDGYATLFAELDEQLDGEPATVVVPMGVGSLAQSAVTHYRGRGSRVSLLGVEPRSAACVLASLRRRELGTIETGATVMDGLNCGTPSSLAWPYLRDGLDAAVAVGEEECARAMGDLEALGVNAGPCGAAALAGIRAVERVDGPVVLLNTEGLNR